MWGVGIRISKVAKTKIYNLVFCKMECTVVFNTSMEGFSQKKKKKKKGRILSTYILLPFT